jgi:hypothetical protein
VPNLASITGYTVQFKNVSLLLLIHKVTYVYSRQDTDFEFKMQKKIEDYCLLGCCAMQFGSSLPMFQTYFLPLSMQP